MPVAYREARSQIRTADALFFRPTSIPGDVISAFSGLYSHAALADNWHGRLMCVGTQQWRGNQPEHLSALVKRFPGVIDVYRCNLPCPAWAVGSLLPPGLNCLATTYQCPHRDSCAHGLRPLRDDEEDAVATAMIGMVGQHYGWLTLGAAALVNLPFRWSRAFWRRVLRATDDTNEGKLPPHCMMAVALAFQRALALDLCPGLAPFATSPSDGARSAYLRYQFTLV